MGKVQEAQGSISHAVHDGRVLANVGDRELAASAPKFPRVFYKAAKSIASMSDAEIASRREQLGITLEAAPPRETFTPLAVRRGGFPPDVLRATANFQKPSPIQSQSWPVVLSGHDMVGIAATGSGKTMAFGLPALTQILARGKDKVEPGRPMVLVLAPTRELAQQTAKVFDEAGQCCGVRTVCVYGGSPKFEQKKLLTQNGGAAVVVATPGRLRDFMNDGDVRLDRVSTLVLDEADRMLDLGFEPEIREIAGATRADRQTVMFSATGPQSRPGRAAEFMCNPVKVRIGAEGLKASHSITQIVEVVEPNDKDAHLSRVLKKYSAARRRKHAEDAHLRAVQEGVREVARESATSKLAMRVHSRGHDAEDREIPWRGSRAARVRFSSPRTSPRRARHQRRRVRRQLHVPADDGGLRAPHRPHRQSRPDRFSAHLLHATRQGSRGGWRTCSGRRARRCPTRSRISGRTSRRKNRSCTVRTSRRWTCPSRRRRSRSTE